MDYRASHQDPSKARAYQESFTRYPYRHIVWEWEQDVLNELIQDFCKDRPYLRYLDFACGTGRILGLLEGYAQESYGVDVSKAMLEVACQSIRHSTLLLGDLTREDLFAERSFDLITAFRFFLNAQQSLREDALRALGKILREDGRLILNIHMSRGCLLERELRVYQALRHIQNPNFRPMSIQETKDLLGAAQFEVLQTYHYGIIPIYQPHHRLLIRQINQFERLASGLPSLLPVSRFVIYVCRLKSSE